MNDEECALKLSTSPYLYTHNLVMLEETKTDKIISHKFQQKLFAWYKYVEIGILSVLHC